MELARRVPNGVVILDDGADIPEGTSVAVVPIDGERRWIECLPGKLPVVHGVPGSVCLSNQKICEVLDHEDVDA